MSEFRRCSGCGMFRPLEAGVCKPCRQEAVTVTLEVLEIVTRNALTEPIVRYRNADPVAKINEVWERVVAKPRRQNAARQKRHRDKLKEAASA